MSIVAEKARAVYCDLPEGWTRRRLRFDTCINPKKSSLNMDPEELVTFVPMEAVGEYGGLNPYEVRELEEVYDGYSYFEDGDLCIAKITPCFENGKGALAEGLTNGVGFGTTELHVVRPGPDIAPRFLFYISIADDFRKLGESEMRGAGGQKRIDESYIKDWIPPLPPLITQHRIARFLDEKTAHIDALIEKKRELLDLLAEKRQALITCAVTKGLNSNATMKQSGIDWLGDIPAHWNVLRLKFITSEPLSYGANAAAEFDELEWPRFVRITDVDEFGGLRNGTFRSLPFEVAQGFLLQPNDILLARSGATVGKSFIYNDSWGIACFAGYLIRARIEKLHDARYFYWFLKSTLFWDWVRSTFIQSTIQNISAERYANLLIPHPSDKIEQKRIADFIEVSCAEIYRQREKIERSLDLLNEYRSAIITAAVTGQIGELNGN